MKSVTLLAWLLLSTYATATRPPPLPNAPVEAHIETSTAEPFTKETFTLTLVITTRDIEIDPQLDLAHLPGNDVMQILGSFDAMAVERERADNQEITRRRYQARARAMVPGTIELAPVLQLTARKRVRSFFGSAMEVRPVSLQVPQTTIHAKPIPDPPENFSGVIGNFEINIEADPLEIQAGDLVTITTTLRGEGWVNEDTLPALSPTPLLRTYRVRAASTAEAARERVFTQTVVPLEQELAALPEISFVWFNTQIASFQHDAFGPFPLQYVQPSPPSTAPTATPETVAAPDAMPHTQGRFRRNRIVLHEATRAYIAPATTSTPTFTIPPMSTIRILEHYQNWILVQHDNNRGWIPAP